MIVWFFTIPTWILMIALIFGAAAAETVGPLVFSVLDFIIGIIILACIPGFWVSLISLIKGDYEEGEGGDLVKTCIICGLVAFFGTNLLISLLVS